MQTYIFCPKCRKFDISTNWYKVIEAYKYYTLDEQLNVTGLDYEKYYDEGYLHRKCGRKKCKCFVSEYNDEILTINYDASKQTALMDTLTLAKLLYDYDVKKLTDVLPPTKKLILKLLLDYYQLDKSSYYFTFGNSIISINKPYKPHRDNIEDLEEVDKVKYVTAHKIYFYHNNNEVVVYPG